MFCEDTLQTDKYMQDLATRRRKNPIAFDYPELSELDKPKHWHDELSIEPCNKNSQD